MNKRDLQELSDLGMSDTELVDKVKNGDRKSFSELVKRHQKGLLHLSLRFMKDLDAAKDVVQESFIKAYEKIMTFEGRASFKSWLYQITVNTARNKLREKRKGMTDINNVQLAVQPEAERTLVHIAISDLLQVEVQKLPIKQKTALILRVYEDLSFQEIATVMECPYDTAKANYRHALLKLREVFGHQRDLKTWSTEMSGIFTELSQAIEVE